MINLKCEYCKKFIQKYPKDVKKSKHHYCSRSCSNRGQPRRKPKGKCKNCNKPIRTKSIRCQECDIKFRGKATDLKTISESFRKGSNKYGNIRDRARTLYSHLRYHGCQLCPYKKHVEICHIKSISDFPESTLVKVVNDPKNIILLCKNCHWELDHNMTNHNGFNIEKWCAEKDSNL